MPGGFKAERHVWLTTAPAESDAISILTSARGDAARSILHHRDEQGEWAAAEIDLDLRRVRSIIHAGGQMTALQTTRGDREVEAVGIRSAGLVLLGRFERPPGRWTAMGQEDEIRLIEKRKADLVLHRVDLVSGAAVVRQAMTVQPLPAARIWNIAIVMAAMGAGILLLFLVRPSAAAVILPKGWEPLPPAVRLLAFSIDLLPAAVLATLILRSDPADLLNLPLFTDNLQQCMPYLLMVTILLGHSTIFECITGRSLGKMMVDAQVMRVDGARPVIGQVLLRNLIKAVVLLVPPLAILAIFSQHLQGLPDQAVGTVVVSHNSTATGEQT